MWKIGFVLALLSAGALSACSGGSPTTAKSDSLSERSSPAPAAAKRDVPAVVPDALQQAAASWPQACDPEKARDLVRAEPQIVGPDGEVAVPARSYNRAAGVITVEVGKSYREHLDDDAYRLEAMNHDCALAFPDHAREVRIVDHGTKQVLRVFDSQELEQLWTAPKTDLRSMQTRFAIGAALPRDFVSACSEALARYHADMVSGALPDVESLGPPAFVECPQQAPNGVALIRIEILCLDGPIDRCVRNAPVGGSADQLPSA